MTLTGKRKQQNKKIQAYRRGIRAEIIAGLYLTLTGWRVLAWRWKCPLGEIDLVAKNGKVITFIEVKARQNEQSALDSITAHQWRRISNAADIFMSQQRQYADCSWRIDAIIIVPRQWPKRFKYMWDDEVHGF
jgi:putative endonuclease